MPLRAGICTSGTLGIATMQAPIVAPGESRALAGLMKPTSASGEEPLSMTAPASSAKPAVPAVRHLLETSLYVRDPARTQEFYQRLFGFPLAFADARLSVLALPGPAVLLLFRKDAHARPSETPGGAIPGHGGSGQLHLCFAIEAADLAPWEGRLAALAIPVESRVRWPRGSESLYFRDPDEHLIELATPGLWPNY